MTTHHKIRVLIWALLFVICVKTAYAQNTYYYKQIKVEKNGSIVAQGKGGQFISFYKDICYDSNNKGISVNNGQMECTSKSGDKYTIYKGNSYWGNVTYYFSTSLDRLVVKKGDGTTYMYQRTEPPSGVTTCSLIKPHSSGGTTGGWSVGYTPPTPNGGWINPQSSQKKEEAKPSPTPNKPIPRYEYVYREKSCPSCHTSRRCKWCGGDGLCDNSYTGHPFKCPNCTNGICSTCNGKGTVTERSLEKQ